MTLTEVLTRRESEHRIEFKEGKTQFSYKGGTEADPGKRRRCVLGYVVALANEGGGTLVFGVRESKGGALHIVVGTSLWEDQEGQLASDIYRDKGIRVEPEVLREEATGRRVLLLHIDRRPVGQVYKFEDVPLMRVGDRLEPMSDAHYRRIINETEPDYSATVCLGLTLADLDPHAIQRMKALYARKQKNPEFNTLPDRQVLSDLDLATPAGEQLTYAALLLLGTAGSLKRYLPQAGLNLEYRPTATSIAFLDRLMLLEPVFGGLDAAWAFINKRNGRIPVRQGLYILDDIPLLNEEVVRESLLNAVAHRDYRRTSEVLVRQFPGQLVISSPGGFPLGVTESNILTVNSTPRNRLLADVLLKTGLVERSGQGVDKIFRNSIVEAKGTPSYHRSDDAQVVLELPALVEDPAFALFIDYVQRELRIELTLEEVLTLEKIRQGVPRSELPEATVQALARRKLLEAVGNTRARHFILAKEYYQFTGESAAYTLEQSPNETVLVQQIHHHLQLFPAGFKMADMYKLFQGRLSMHQVKDMVYRLRNEGVLDAKGSGRGTTYTEGNRWREDSERMQRAIDLGIEQMKAQGEWPSEPMRETS